MVVHSLSASVFYAIGLIRSADARVNAASARSDSKGRDSSAQLANQLKIAAREREIAAKLIQMEEQIDQHLINMLT